MGNVGEQTLIGFISVDNNAQRLCNLCANLPEERLNGKIPALRLTTLLCWTALMWPYIFLAECHCIDSIMLVIFFFSSLLSFYWNNNNSFSYTFLWVYAVKCTCSHSMIQAVLRRLGKVFQFSLKWNFEWLLTNNKTHFLENLGLFFIFLQTLEVFWSSEPGTALAVREKL